MAVETGLKLRTAPQLLAMLKRHLLPGKHQDTRPVTRGLHGICYDSPEPGLRAKAQ